MVYRNPSGNRYRRVEGPPQNLRKQHENAYTRNLTFSGCDIYPVAYGVDSKGKPKLFVVGEIATLTYSVHQEKGAVRTLGRTAPRNFTRGQETIAGTMIFSVFNNQALHDIANYHRDYNSHKPVTLTQLPMFDIVLYFKNEAGHQASLGIFGIQFADEGQSHSVEDTYVENTSQFLALKLEPLERISEGSPLLSPQTRAEFLTDRKLSRRGLGPTGLPFDYSYLPRNFEE